jgi:hypothetical protein
MSMFLLMRLCFMAMMTMASAAAYLVFSILQSRFDAESCKADALEERVRVRMRMLQRS